MKAEITLHLLFYDVIETKRKHQAAKLMAARLDSRYDNIVHVQLGFEYTQFVKLVVTRRLFVKYNQSLAILGVIGNELNQSFSNNLWSRKEK